MSEDKIRKTLREQIDNYHAYNQEYGNDTLMASVAYQIAIDDLEGWDLRGLVPMSVWVAMTKAQQQTIKDQGDFRVRFCMTMGAILTVSVTLLTTFAGWIGLMLSGFVSFVIMAAITAYLHDVQEGWSAMISPGTASSLKHTSRLYTEANAQLERSKMRGALTADDGVQVAGQLTMAGEQGQLEVCDGQG